ncbi:MAG: hypothetical protein ACTHJM_05250 [Marmoricola sp.]
MGIIASIVAIVIVAVGLLVLLSVAVRKGHQRRLATRERRVLSPDAPLSELARYDQAPYLHTGHREDPRR